jgi:mono/diheme cytochrome c family protein
MVDRPDGPAPPAGLLSVRVLRGSGAGCAADCRLMRETTEPTVIVADSNWQIAGIRPVRPRVWSGIREVKMTGTASWWVAAVAACAALAVSGSAAGETFDRGQALYENHCMSCHETTVPTRETHRATSLADLRKWVATWSFHAALDWSREEIDDVTDYIDRRYYHFAARQ